MSRRRLVALCVLVLVLGAVGFALTTTVFGSRGQTFDFSPMLSADSLTVRVSGGGVERPISDAKAVAACVGFLQSHRDRWQAPWFGIPVGRVQIVFLSQAKPLGTLEIGKGFVSTQQAGGFYTRSISTDEVDQLLAAVGLSSKDLG